MLQRTITKRPLFLFLHPPVRMPLNSTSGFIMSSATLYQLQGSPVYSQRRPVVVVILRNICCKLSNTDSKVAVWRLPTWTARAMLPDVPITHCGLHLANWKPASSSSKIITPHQCICPRIWYHELFRDILKWTCFHHVAFRLDNTTVSVFHLLFLQNFSCTDDYDMFKLFEADE
jgi:hypothetical protein